MQVELVSSGYDSIQMNVVLPNEGTTPLVQLEVEFIQPQRDAVNVSLSNSNLGERVYITLSDLQDGTLYTISLSVYNYGGKGMQSQQIQVETGES